MAGDMAGDSSMEWSAARCTLFKYLTISLGRIDQGRSIAANRMSIVLKLAGLGLFLGYEDNLVMELVVDSVRPLSRAPVEQFFQLCYLHL